MRVSSGMPGISLSDIALRRAASKERHHQHGIQRTGLPGFSSLLDFPVPFLPTSAYLWPALSRRFALTRISLPSALALALAFPLGFAVVPCC